MSDEVVNTLIGTSQGDLRRSITYLQSASRLAASTNPPTPITPSDIQEIAGVVPDPVINAFAATVGIEMPSNDMDIDGGGAKKAKEFNAIRTKVKEIVREGYSAAQILSQVRLLVLYACNVLNLATASRPCGGSSNFGRPEESEVCAGIRRG